MLFCFEAMVAAWSFHQTSTLKPNGDHIATGASTVFQLTEVPKVSTKFMAKKSTRHFFVFHSQNQFSSHFCSGFQVIFCTTHGINCYWEQHFLERSEGHPPSKHLPGPKSLKLESDQGPNKNLIIRTLTLIAAYHSPLPYNWVVFRPPKKQQMYMQITRVLITWLFLNQPIVFFESNHFGSWIKKNIILDQHLTIYDSSKKREQSSTNSHSSWLHLGLKMWPKIVMIFINTHRDGKTQSGLRKIDADVWRIMYYHVYIYVYIHSYMSVYIYN